ncbi:hypothetical protein CVT26_016012 [Gymnopilus dilepis]|uniref:Alpha/beta hydrolase fold-3 domain-containing protein n=1 Tax=Gymnopilus dilepis TaxID=231916 RepID=A0A409YDJ7_9AGAR|nr:hypothetical protein CVT26_016012 [Gymnopilus dilepis]
MSSESQPTPKQPLHPSIIPRLDPEYVEFHNKHIIHLTPPHTLPWDPSIRNAPAVPGTSEPLKVAKTQDFDLPKARFRAFTPEGEKPDGGWPWIGGWTLGNIGSETHFSTNMAVHARCVVISVDYRLAPENPYPAAVEDAVDALDWVVNNGAKELGINPNRIAVGGSSRYILIFYQKCNLIKDKFSGGNLAAILALKAAQAQPPIPLLFQLLIVPVTDNTASVSDLWADNALSPWLTPERMMWFRNNYLPNKEDWTKWDASPIFAPEELLKKVPKAWIGVCELDILRDEGVKYGEKLKAAGVEVEVEVYKGAPHPVMAMDG